MRSVHFKTGSHSSGGFHREIYSYVLKNLRITGGGNRIRVWPAYIDPTVAYHAFMHVIDQDRVLDSWEVDLRGW